MPSSSPAIDDRREALRQMLNDAPQPNQQRLVERLRSRGFAATQSSVSRDLRVLGAMKTSRGYELPAAETADDFLEAVGLLRGVNAAGPYLLVIRTATGAAQRVAVALDRCGWPEIAGTVAGDDTVFVATGSGQAQRQVLTRLQQHGAAA